MFRTFGMNSSGATIHLLLTCAFGDFLWCVAQTRRSGRALWHTWRNPSKEKNIPAVASAYRMRGGS